MSQTLTAVIPAKGESKRLPHKNILPFGNSNLLLHKIEQLQKADGITQIILSTDSDEMMEMAASVGVSSIRRPPEFANEDLPFWMFCDYLADVLPNDHVMYACVTSPMISHHQFTESIRLYFENLDKGYDSLITTEIFQHFMMDQNGPMNFGIGKAHSYSQNLPRWYAFTNGINIAPRAKMKEWHYNFGPHPFCMPVDKVSAADIDDIYDYEYAKALFQLEKERFN